MTRLSQTQKERLTRTSVPEILKRYQINPDSLVLLQDSRNLTYQGESPDGKVILKIIPSDKSIETGLLGEVDWIAHLSSKGISAPKVYRSSQGNYVETIQAEDLYLNAYCLQKIEGVLWGEAPAGSVPVQSIGHLAGLMHAHSKGYTPSIPEARRPFWYDAPWLKHPEKIIHPSMARVIEISVKISETIASFPKTDFGIVHDDLHGWNVIVNDDAVTAIDFENSHYTWLASEISSTLYFYMWKTPENANDDRGEKAKVFLSEFLEGYVLANPIPKHWQKMVPTFLKSRELSIFASSGLQDRDFEEFGSHDKQFSFTKENLENDVPYIDMDFDSQ